MADYYPLLSRAVADSPTSEHRRQIYARARDALIKQLGGHSPPRPDAEITRERLALEDAIRKVEAEAVRRVRPHGPSAPTAAPRPDATGSPPGGPLRVSRPQHQGQPSMPPSAASAPLDRVTRTVEPPTREVEQQARRVEPPIRTEPRPREASVLDERAPPGNAAMPAVRSYAEGIVRKLTRAVSSTLRTLRRRESGPDLPGGTELLKHKLRQRGFDAALLPEPCLQRLAASSTKYARRLAEINARRCGTADTNEAFEQTVSETLDYLQRDRSPEFLEVKEALFPDAKQALFAEVKQALQSYAADVRKPAAIDRPAAR
jgi:hypothetical protein